MGDTIQLNTTGTQCIGAYVAKPNGTPKGGLVVVQEIFGVNSHIRSVCDGYAADGYRVIAPALFDRAERGVDIGYSAQEIERGVALKQKSDIANALLDVAAARDALKDAGKIGITGYCWGGYVTWMAAARTSGFACAIPYYGGGMLEASDEKPKCPVMAHFGERDGHIPVAGVRQFAAKHPDVQVFIYPADHGFNCDQRGSFDAPSAKLARERTLAFLREHVG